MKKAFGNASKKAVEGNNYTKFTTPRVSRGKTAFPSGSLAQSQLGIRYDYDGIVTRDGIECHKYNVQPNAGNNIPSSIKRWREANGGMSTVYVKKDGTKQDVENALEEAHKDVKM
ncbi:hypothetical protein DOTSEDRAFT_152750 [Dothistroma septosporum NZE10]|uniref:Uncharacterized protein n=1 Tax=Dothistroma septosporum (strain NZE10 / CBS 128990) TaxID=675120 RepID=N1PMS9_DOTSN|nr:hypothetical protein DOTSEDRAFT_152750 [Dothistroma septosporum NZE10]